MIIFIKLLLAHLLGDFLLQPTKWVVDKETKKHKSIYLYLHILLNGVLAWILVGEIQFGWFAVVVAKSIFRFGDLKEATDRKLTEYVLIGTL